MTNKEAIEILSVIRHTPSVEVFNTLPNSADSYVGFDYREAFNLAIKTLEERVQGEWIECTKSGMPLTEYGRMMGEKWYGFKCSRCKFIYKGNALVESPFCQKCGAKMQN